MADEPLQNFRKRPVIQLPSLQEVQAAQRPAQPSRHFRSSQSSDDRPSGSGRYSHRQAVVVFRYTHPPELLYASLGCPLCRAKFMSVGTCPELGLQEVVQQLFLDNFSKISQSISRTPATAVRQEPTCPRDCVHSVLITGLRRWQGCFATVHHHHLYNIVSLVNQPKDLQQLVMDNLPHRPQSNNRCGECQQTE